MVELYLINNKAKFLKKKCNYHFRFQLSLIECLPKLLMQNKVEIQRKHQEEMFLKRLKVAFIITGM